MFMGLVEKWLKDFLWVQRMYAALRGQTPEAEVERPISLIDLQGSFFLLTLGYSAAFVALSVEVLLIRLLRGRV